MTTLNPSDKKNVNVVLSGGNLTVTGTDTGGNNWVRSTTAQTGQRYIEFTTTTVANTIFGIADASGITTYPGNDAKSFGLFSNGFGSINGTFPDWGGGTPYNTYASGNVVGMAVDLTAKLVWFRIGGGNWNGSAGNSPSTATGGISISAYTGTTHYVVVSGDNTCVTTVNFGATAFAASAPSGFLSWDGVAPTGRCKVWTGSAWVVKPVKWWSGSAWVTKPMKVWSGSAWI
jgi:hypothetical protein